MRQHLRDLVILLAVFGGLPFQVMTDSPAYAQTPALRMNGVQFGPGDGTVYVPTKGCKGDGVADDTTCITNAITSANGAAEVVLPAGTYLVRNIPIAIANTRIRGLAGATMKLKAEVCGDGAPIINITANNVTITGITFDGNKSAQAADGFSDSFAGGGVVCGGSYQLGRSYRADIAAYNSGGEIVGLTVDGCTFTNTYGAAVATQNVSQVRIRNNFSSSDNFEIAYLASTYTGSQYLSDVQVTGNMLRNTGSGDGVVNADGIVITRAKNFLVSHNIVDTIERTLAKVQFSTGGSITDNILDTNTVANFGMIQLQDDCSDIIIANNKAHNVGAGILLNRLSGTVGFSNIGIIGNVITTTTGSTGDGISVAPGAGTSSGIQIIGNTLKGIARYGVFLTLTAAMNDVTVSGNRVDTTGTVNGGGVVIAPGTTSSNYLVASNHIDLGNINVNASGIEIFASTGTLSNFQLIGNSVAAGSGHKAITEGSGAITSGNASGNYTDGTVSAPDLASTMLFPLRPTTAAGATQTGSVYQGSGAPSNSNGNNGDVYFRTDTPGTANQRIYVKSAGSWTGIL